MYAMIAMKYNNVYYDSAGNQYEYILEHEKKLIPN